MRIPEILAPAGGLVQLRAAVNNGADAVYLGGARFNARGKAENFTLPKLRDAIAYAHERDVKIYVTFNTLLKDRELPEALEYAGALWDIGADAVIVQDMGLVRMLGKHMPDLPLHMSTQGTVAGKWAVDLMKDFGIRRIVPARELNLEEIREMAAVCHGTERLVLPGGGAREETARRSAADGEKGRRAPSCELEVFVHGALCMCYSGQCQMSRLLGAAGGKGSVRSGNRGLCAQPCRLPYTDDQGRTGYFLSPKDLCLLDEIPALCEAGVDSLKIEGRLKSPEYVAIVTSIYRKYLDQFAQTGAVRVSQEDRRDLMQIYNRGGFTKGYLYGHPGAKLLSGTSPKNTGICIGTVRAVVDKGSAGKDKAAAAGAAKKGAVLVDVALREPLEEGDGVEFRPAEGGVAGDKGARSAGSSAAGGVNIRLAAEAPAGGVVTFRRAMRNDVLRIGDMKGRIQAGDSVFRVTQRALLERARETFDTEDPAELDRRMIRPLSLRMRFTAAVGQPAELEIWEVRTQSSGMQGSEAGRVPGAVCVPGEVRISSPEPVEEARNRTTDPERIRQQLGKLGGTPFVVRPEDIQIRLEGPCAVPAAQINRMRREGISQLLREKRKVRREPADMTELTEAGKALGEARLRAPEAPDMKPVPLMEWMERRAATAQGEVVAEPAGRDVACGKDEGDGSGACELPTIDAVCKGRLDAYIEERFDEIVARLKEAGCGILIRGNSWVRQFLDAGVRVYGGHGLNVYNEEARLAWEDLGVTVLELSHEAAEGSGAQGADDPVDEWGGRIPLMVTEHEIQSKTLTDRKGQVHRIERSSAGDKTVVW